MNVLILASGADTGGQGERIRQAFARLQPDWQIDALALQQNPITARMPRQEHPYRTVSERNAYVRRLWAQADVVHLRNSSKALDWYGMDKPAILHHHGTAFRNGHGAIARDARRRGMAQFASTLDLAMLEPDVTWLPAPFDLAMLAALRDSGKSSRTRISHFPTNTKVKSSPVVARAVASLDVDFVSNLTRPDGRMFRPIPWAEVLRQKAASDIYVDQLWLGIGNNAIEAMGMGVPVVAGVGDPAVRARMIEEWGSLPFVEATEDDLPAVLKRLVGSSAMREEYAAKGLTHARRWHDGTETVARLTHAYTTAQPTQARNAVRVAA